MFLSWSRFLIPDSRFPVPSNSCTTLMSQNKLNGFVSTVHQMYLVEHTTIHTLLDSSFRLQPSASSILCIDVVSLEFCLPSISSSITVSAWQICLFPYLICLSSYRSSRTTIPFHLECVRGRHLLMHLGWADGPGRPSILFYLLSFELVLPTPTKQAPVHFHPISWNSHFQREAKLLLFGL